MWSPCFNENIKRCLFFLYFMTYLCFWGVFFTDRDIRYNDIALQETPVFRELLRPGSKPAYGDEFHTTGALAGEKQTDGNSFGCGKRTLWKTAGMATHEAVLCFNFAVNAVPSTTSTMFHWCRVALKGCGSLAHHSPRLDKYGQSSVVSAWNEFTEV